MAKPDWKKIVGAVAPSLATALGGPLAGVAVKALSDGLLGKKDASEDEIAAALQGGDSETLLKLKEIDLNFKKSMADAGIKLEELAAADRASARERETKLGGDVTVKILAYTIIGSFCTMCFALLWGEVTAESTIVGAVIGYLSAKAEQVIAYYFGSSHGSTRKTELLAGASAKDVR
jgi:hypothetical protein